MDSTSSPEQSCFQVLVSPSTRLRTSTEQNRRFFGGDEVRQQKIVLGCATPIEWQSASRTSLTEKKKKLRFRSRKKWSPVPTGWNVRERGGWQTR